MMIIDHGHPNFPPNLSISQNSAHKSALDDVFGEEAQRGAISRYGIAGRVWEAACALCAYVSHNTLDFEPSFIDDPDERLGVIELGSGTGIVAANIAYAIRRTARPGGIVIATDLPDVCPLLQHNLGVQGSGGVTHRADALGAIFVRPLAWGHFSHATAIVHEFNFDGPPDASPRQLTHIICSDLVYFPELFGPLLRTLIHLTSLSCHVPVSSAEPKVVISYKIRSLAKETSFWMAFGLWFSFRPLLVRRQAQCGNDDVPGMLEPRRQLGTDEDSDQTFVFVAYRRPESIAWDVPETDTELIAGVGARDSAAEKGDDTFETILFMAMGT